MLNQLNSTTKRELDAKYLSVYLDTEHEVGRFGDDTLYSITIDCGLLWNSQAKSITTQIVADKIIAIDGIAISSTNIINLPHVGTGSGDGHVALNINKNSSNVLTIVITSNSDRTTYTGYVTLYYTKPAPAPNPKDSNETPTQP